jgi:hypothetical protein
MNDATLDDVAGRQNGSGLELRLRGLADHVEAPPSACTRQVIGGRTRRLRRRRQVRRAAAGAAMAVAIVVVGGAAVLRHDPADVQIGPARENGGSGDLPVIALDPDEWAVTHTVEHDDVDDLIGESARAEVDGLSVQVFRPEGRFDGPVMVLEHSSASDAVVPGAGDEQVDVNGTPAYLSEANGTVDLRWGVPYSDSHARLTGFGIDATDVVDFARGLELRDDDLDFPVDADADFGFTVTELPRGVVEVALPHDEREPVNVRQAWFERRVGEHRLSVGVQIDNRGERAFELDLYAPDALLPWDTVEQVTVLDRSALLWQDPIDGAWNLRWRHADGAWVRATIAYEDTAPAKTVDRATVDGIIDDLRELPPDAWQRLDAGESPG